MSAPRSFSITCSIRPQVARRFRVYTICIEAWKFFSIESLECSSSQLPQGGKPEPEAPMRPATSPFLTAAIAAAFALTASETSVLAQQTTTVEKTTTTTTVVREVPPPRAEIKTTEIEFQPASSANDINTQMLR